MPLLINESSIEFGEMLSGWYNEEAHPLYNKTTRETSQAVVRRPGQIPGRHDLAEDNSQDGLTWRRHAEVLAQPGTLRLPNDDDDDDGDDTTRAPARACPNNN